MKKREKLVGIVMLSIITAACGGGSGPGASGSVCEDLLRQADALKDRPLQRTAIMERYNAECTRPVHTAPPSEL